MQIWAQDSIQWLLLVLALPKVGLSSLFVVSLLSATLLPLGSEPAVFGFVKLAPDMFWLAILVATAGNTAGGAITYLMGAGAQKAYAGWREAHEHVDGNVESADHPRPGGRWHVQIHRCVDHAGPAVLLFSWLPVLGDLLCAAAGWLRLSFWPCVLYMAIGKWLRYAALTSALMWVFPSLA
jgi:membrane protein YqaA with SNARE-associated domain